MAYVTDFFWQIKMKRNKIINGVDKKETINIRWEWKENIILGSFKLTQEGTDDKVSRLNMRNCLRDSWNIIWEKIKWEFGQEGKRGWTENV